MSSRDDKTMMRIPSKREQEKAQEIMDWLPRPIFLDGAHGPGRVKLSALAPGLGWGGLKSCTTSAVMKPRTLRLVNEAWVAMQAEMVLPAPEPVHSLSSRLDSIEASIKALDEKVTRLLEVWK